MTTGRLLALPALALALALAARPAAAAPATCSSVRAQYATSPWDGKALNASLFSTGWSGPFDSTRTNGLRYTGTAVNYVTADFLYQTAYVTQPVSLSTTLTYCPLNITAVPNQQLAAGVVGTRYDIFWVLDSLPDPTISRVQCMSLAIVGTRMMSWQVTLTSLCPSVTYPVPSVVTAATYTDANAGRGGGGGSASGASSVRSSALGALALLLLLLPVSLVAAY